MQLYVHIKTVSVMRIDIAARLHSIQIGDEDDFTEEPHVRFEDITDDSIPAEVSFDDPTAGDILSVCIAFAGTHHVDFINGWCAWLVNSQAFCYQKIRKVYGRLVYAHTCDCAY
jgi:hypothetical protein